MMKHKKDCNCIHCVVKGSSIREIWLCDATAKDLSEIEIHDWLEGYGSIDSLAEQKFIRKYGFLLIRLQTKTESVDEHFKHAGKIIDSWPKWKQEIGFGIKPEKPLEYPDVVEKLKHEANYLQACCPNSTAASDLMNQAAEEINFLQERNDRQCKTIINQRGEIERLKKLYDNPQWDATDAAHPAWWRGEDYGCFMATKLIADVLSGKNDCSGRMNEPAETMRNSVFELKQERDELKKLNHKITLERNRLFKRCEIKENDYLQKLNEENERLRKEIETMKHYWRDILDIIKEKNRLKEEREKCFIALNKFKPDIPGGHNLDWQVEKLLEKNNELKDEIHELKIERGKDWDEIRSLEIGRDGYKTTIKDLEEQLRVTLIENKRLANLQKELQLEKITCEGAFHEVDRLGAELENVKKKLQQNRTILRLHIDAYDKLQQERDGLQEEIKNLNETIRCLEMN